MVFRVADKPLTLREHLRIGNRPPHTPSAELVAASDASTRVKDIANYICDGINDEVQIQAALDALPSGGGRVLLSEGTFSLKKTSSNWAVTVPGDNITLEGQGNSTILEYGADPGASCYMVDVAGRTGIRVRNIKFQKSTAYVYGEGLVISAYCYDFIVAGCWFKNFAYAQDRNDDAMGLYIHRSSRGVLTGLTFEGCGISMAFSYSDTIEVSDFFILSGKTWGIFVEHEASSTNGRMMFRDFEIKSIAASVLTGSSTLASDATGGDTALAVDDGSVFSNGDWIRIGNNDPIEDRRITTVVTNTLNLETAISWSHAAATEGTVRRISRSEHGFYLQGSKNTIRDGLIHDCDAMGIRALAASTIDGDDTIDNVRIWNVRAGAITFGSAGGNLHLKILNCHVSAWANARQWYTGNALLAGIEVSGDSNERDVYQHLIGNTVLIPTEAKATVLAGFHINGTPYDKIVHNTVVGTAQTNQEGMRVQAAGATPSDYCDIAYNTLRSLQVGISLQETIGQLQAVRNRFITVTTPFDLTGAGAGNRIFGNPGYVTENSGTATVANGTTTKVVAHGLAAVPTRVYLTATLWSNAAKAWVTAIGATNFTINVDADPGAGTATFNWKAQVGEG